MEKYYFHYSFILLNSSILIVSVQDIDMKHGIYIVKDNRGWATLSRSFSSLYLFTLLWFSDMCSDAEDLWLNIFLYNQCTKTILTSSYLIHKSDQSHTMLRWHFFVCLFFFNLMMNVINFQTLDSLHLTSFSTYYLFLKKFN